MKAAAIAAAISLAACGPLCAQTIVAQPVGQAPAATWTLPANTELTVTPNSELSSKTLKEGDTFTVSTVYDVLMSNYIVIPKGTRGQGKVTWRTGKGAFGKSAKMDIALEWIDVGGRRVTIEGKHRQEGSGNTAATLGTVAAVGPFAAFVTGKSATIPNGMQLKAFTAEPIAFQTASLPPAPVQAQIVPISTSPNTAPVVAQGTSPAVTSVSSGDKSQ
jgi:hypothetical protein